MYKDGNTISIDLLYDTPTEERNGLEVLVYLKSDYDVERFCQAIKSQLTYFENLFIINSSDNYHIENLEREFNSFKIKRFNHFQVNSLYSHGVDLILGKVRYPLRADNLSKSYPSNVWRYPISLCFEVGDLEITPNREEILYSKKNIEKIEEVLDAAVEELEGYIEGHLNKDYTDFEEYLKAIKTNYSMQIFDNVFVEIDKKKRRYTLDGVYYKPEDFIYCRDFIFNRALIDFSYTVEYGKITGIRAGVTNVEHLKRRIDNGNVFICDISNLKVVAKDYLRQEIRNAKILSTFPTVSYYIKKYLTKYRQSIHHYDEYKYSYLAFRRIILEAKKSVAKLKVFSDKTVPKSFIQERNAAIAKRKAEGALNKRKLSHLEINMYALRFSNRGRERYASEAVPMFLDKINTQTKRLNIYAEKDNEKLRNLYGILSDLLREVRVYEVAPTKMKLLADVNSCVKLEDFLNVEYKLIRKIATARLIKDSLPQLKELYSIKNLGDLSVKLEKVVKTLHEYKTSYYKENMNKEEEQLSLEIFELCKQRNYFDEEIRGLLQENKKMLDNAKFLVHLTNEERGRSWIKELPKERMEFIVDYIILKKFFRPNASIIESFRKAEKSNDVTPTPEEGEEEAF